MRLICPISGIEYPVPQFPRIGNIAFEHPIFSLSISDLLPRAKDWLDGNLDSQERRLLFLALLKKTEKFIFTVPAVPADKTVQENMEQVIRTVGWFSTLPAAVISIPMFKITPETRRLSNISFLLETWEANRYNWQDGIKARNHKQHMMEMDATLERLIKSVERQPESYSRRIADWAFDASGATVSQRERWLPIFLSKGQNIFNLNSALIQECEDFLVDNLHNYHGTIQGNAVMSYIRNTSKQNRSGWFDAIGGFIFKEDEIEGEFQNHLQKAISNAPSIEPKESDFPGDKIAYLRAKAAYRLATSYREDNERKEELFAVKLQQEEASLRAEVTVSDYEQDTSLDDLEALQQEFGFEPRKSEDI